MAQMTVDGEPLELTGSGNGPLAALVDGFERQFGITVRIRDYHEHAMAASASATAAAYVEADVDDDAVWGVGLHPSILRASLLAIVNAVNRVDRASGGGRDGELALRRVVTRSARTGGGGSAPPVGRSGAGRGSPGRPA